MNKIPLVVYIIAFLFAFALFFSKVFIAWFISRSQYYSLSLRQLFGMYFRKQNLYKMVKIHNTIKENNLDLTLEQVEIFTLRNGRIEDLLQEAKNDKKDYKVFNFEKFSEVYFKDKRHQTDEK